MLRCPICGSRDVVPDERGLGWYCLTTSPAHTQAGVLVSARGVWFTDGKPSDARACPRCKHPLELHFSAGDPFPCMAGRDPCGCLYAVDAAQKTSSGTN